jgi:hypothetical protein
LAHFRAIIGGVDTPADQRHPQPGEPAGTDEPAGRADRNWGTKIVLVLITLVMLALAGLLAVTWLPRWWAHRVGAVVDGTISAGVFAGLTCGVVFTALPLLMLRRVFGRHGSVASRVVWLVAALLVAGPNLTTLAIVLGNGNAAHAAERTLDVEAPAFRGATLVGAVIGAVLAIAWWGLLAGRRRRRRRVAELEAELERRDQQERATRQGQQPRSDT